MITFEFVATRMEEAINNAFRYPSAAQTFMTHAQGQLYMAQQAVLLLQEDGWELNKRLEDTWTDTWAPMFQQIFCE